MQLKRWTSFAAAILTSAGLCMSATAPAAGAESTGFVKYVALGDSFSAGEGIEPFFNPKDSCHRSKLAYPTLIEMPGQPSTTVREAMRDGSEDVEWGFLACSGAETIGSARLGLDDQIVADDDPDSAYDDIGRPLDENTTLVTVTIGGNDVHFSDVLSKCFLSDNCTTEKYGGKKLQELIEQDMQSLGPRLTEAYQKIHDRAPNAVVLVAGYPQLFPQSKAEQDCGKLAQRNVPFTNFSQGWSNTEQDFLRQRGDALNALIAERVYQMPFAVMTYAVGPGQITYVPVEDRFRGHEICGESGEWINGPTASVRSRSVNDQSFHPNDDGQRDGYAAAINAVVNLGE